MSTHPHANVIKAWADGSKIEWRYPGMKEWSPVVSPTPEFYPAVEFRVAPGEENVQCFRLALIEDQKLGLRPVVIQSKDYPLLERRNDFRGWLSGPMRFDPGTKSLEL